MGRDGDVMLGARQRSLSFVGLLLALLGLTLDVYIFVKAPAAVPALPAVIPAASSSTSTTS